MNILPKKNWHVRKKENIARVRRDEAEAAEKEKEIERRAKLAEQEARVAFLRNRARERDGIQLDDESSENKPNEKESRIEADIFTSDGNINFFKEAEAGITTTGTNKEYEEEKKEEKEDYEKKIGLLTYLGQDTFEAQGKTAWFNEREHIIPKRTGDASEESEIGLKSKLKLDPLNEMKKHTNLSLYPKIENPSFSIQTKSESNGRVKSKNLCRKDKKHKKEKLKKRKRKRSLSSDSEAESKRKRKKKKHSKKGKRKSSVDDYEENKDSNHLQLAKLREERLKREAHERKREERLLAGKNPDLDEKEVAKSTLPFKQKYNSQFNPHIAKQNQEHSIVQTTTLQTGVKYWLN